MITNLFYTFFYKIRPIRIVKLTLKILAVTKMILLDEISYYPNKVHELEESFSRITRKKHALSFSNGTSALEAALFAIEKRLGARKTVLVPAMNFHADLDAIVNAGYNIKFVDINSDHILPEITDIINAIDESVGCVVVCHLFGYHFDCEQLVEYLRKRNIILIEDCSHAHCELIDDYNIVKYSEISFFSLQGAKGVAAGEGGVAVTNDRELFIRMSAYSHYGRHESEFGAHGLYDFIGTGVGHKHRMHPLGAALATVDIKYLNVSNRIIEINADKLNKILIKYDVSPLSADSSKTSRFGGLPVIVGSIKDADILEKVFIHHSIRHKRRPFLNHNRLIRYDCQIILPNTESVLDRMILLDRRYLEFLPRFFESKIDKALREFDNTRMNYENKN